MPFSVLVEIAVSDASPAQTEALLEACTQAAAEARCLLADDPALSQPRAIAIVSWTGQDRLAARVEVGLKRDHRNQWVVRDVTFRDDDEPMERWRAVGLIVGTLVGEVARPAEPPREEPTPPPPSVRPPPRGAATPPPRPRPEPPWLTLDVAALVGSAREGGGPRLGGSLRPAARLAKSSFRLLGSVRYSMHGGDGGEDPDIAWLSIAGGLGQVPWETATLALDLRVEVVAELIRATTTDSLSGLADSGHRWSPGLRAGLDLAWSASDFVGLIAGGDVTQRLSATEINVRGAQVARSPAFGGAGQLGVRLMWH